MGALPYTHHEKTTGGFESPPIVAYNTSSPLAARLRSPGYFQ